MTQLYPIGTQLITRRLSQAALYMEIIYGNRPWLCDLSIKNNESKWINVNEQLNCEQSLYTTKQVLAAYFFNEGARVTVTEENQKWLSPVPMVTDILKRLYPNGQRAPMIEWDEVILPTKGFLP